MKIIKGQMYVLKNGVIVKTISKRRFKVYKGNGIYKRWILLYFLDNGKGGAHGSDHDVVKLYRRPQKKRKVLMNRVAMAAPKEI